MSRHTTMAEITCRLDCIINRSAAVAWRLGSGVPCFLKTLKFHTFEQNIWNRTQHNVWAEWMEGMRIHWNYLITSLHKLVQTISLATHATSALHVQASNV